MDDQEDTEVDWKDIALRVMYVHTRGNCNCEVSWPESVPELNLSHTPKINAALQEWIKTYSTE